MTKQERARLIDKSLAKLFPNPPIPLDHSDPFTLLVAVILSAQTTDKKVNQVTPELFKWAPTPEKMKELGIEKVQELIKQVGLAPQKAKALVGMSQKLIDEFDSKVPSDFEKLISLPGVGRKTAQVIMAQVFNQPAFPVDTHIDRLAHKWKLTSGKTVLQTEKDLKSLFPEKRWNELHLQFIYYGRTICQSFQCDGKQCQLCQKMF